MSNTQNYRLINLDSAFAPPSSQVVPPTIPSFEDTKDNEGSNKEFDLKQFMETYPSISGMMGKNQIYGILYHLKEVLDNNIEGDIVELGCNVGTTSIFIKRFLDIYAPYRKYHVYDSWEGLPPKVEQDHSTTSYCFREGSCKTTREYFLKVFEHFNLSPPIIHSGWFKDIPDEQYPEKICFAFYDGDFYSSIMDSFDKTFNKVQRGGVIIIDDIGGVNNNLETHPLPGAERAVIDHLKNKKETYDYCAYAQKVTYEFGIPCGGAKIHKL